MSFDHPTDDQAALGQLGARLKRRRLARDLTQARLAHEAGVSKRTLERLEGGASTQTTSLVRILRALDILEDIQALAAEQTPSPMEQVAAERPTRRRAPSESAETPSTSWAWGDDS
ncbi:MAG: transcriptional regulator with XRE-family HTH domain [Planctomycetota bacterium]|jgi:transcriptional regulator with XRE-family HTH domain